jgi:hypothetical protein
VKQSTAIQTAQIRHTLSKIGLAPTQEGWQMVAGGRFGERDERTPDHRVEAESIMKGCQNTLFLTTEI